MRKRFKQKNNKGFSLVELIISFALLGVVAIGVFMVMSAGSNMFTSVDRQINVQYKSQTAMSQFQQYFMACSKGITVYDYEGNGIIYFDNGDEVCAFRYDSGGKAIYFGSAGTSSAKTDLTADKITDPFCSGVEGFSLTVLNQGSGANAQSIRVDLTVADNSGKTYNSNQIFSFRNRPVYVSAPADEESTLLDTYVDTITGALEAGD